MSLQWMAKGCKGEDFWGYIKTQEGVDNTFKMQATMEGGIAEAQRFLEKKSSELGTAKDHFIQYMDKARRGPKVSADKEEYLRNVADWMRTQAPTLLQASKENEVAKAALREAYLKKNGLSRGEGNQPGEFDSVVEACKQLQGFTGYAFIGAHGIDADGKQHGHGIAVYFSDNCVRVMDPNHGEMAASGRQVGLTGLEGHLHEFFKPGMLGELERIEVDLFPSTQRPDRVENLAARANGRGREAETEGASNLNNNNNAQIIVNNNNAPSVANSNHDVPATENSGGDPE
jgi:hypothetical protein